MKAYIKKSNNFYFIYRFQVPGSVPCKYCRGFKYLIVATDTGIYHINYKNIIF